MNRRKNEKSLLRKQENVYVLDLFVKVPPSAITPRQAHGGRRNRSSCRWKRAKETSHVPMQQPDFLTAGGVSVEDRFKRTETVRPQVDERCEW